MADLFSRLARRTLENSPRLAARVPSRFEPVRGAAGNVMGELQPLTAREDTGPAGLRAPGVLTASEPPVGLLPPRPDAHAAVEVKTGSPGDVGVNQARSATSEHGSTDPRADAADSTTAVPAIAAPRPGEPPATDRSRREKTEAVRSTVLRESAEPRFVRERHREPDRGIGEPSGASSFRSKESPVGLDDLAALEQRLRPLLPRQPVPMRAAATRAEAERGDRAGRRREPSPPPAVEVTIGSIEVRAAVAAAPPSPARHGPTLTLDDYLKRRDRGGP